MTEVRITAWNTRFDPLDDRVLRQTDEFFRELGHGTGALVQRPAPAPPGTKGALTDTMLLLTSPAVVAGTVTVTRAWLNRDRHRRVSVQWEENGEVRTVVVEADSADNGTLRTALEQALGGRPRPGDRPGADGNRPRSGDRPEVDGNRPRSGDRPEVDGNRPRSGNRPEVDGNRPRSGNRPRAEGDRRASGHG
ncbi:effector-associated constant component EACC1 [Streptomyces sp. NPDC002845]